MPAAPSGSSWCHLSVCLCSVYTVTEKEALPSLWASSQAQEMATIPLPLRESLCFGGSSTIGLRSLQQPPEAEAEVANQNGAKRRGAREDSVNVSGLLEMEEGYAQLWKWQETRRWTLSWSLLFWFLLSNSS